jgi:hypothetical protein
MSPPPRCPGISKPTRESPRTRDAPLPGWRVGMSEMLRMRRPQCKRPDPQAVRAGRLTQRGLPTRVLTPTIGPSERSALMDDREIQAPYNKSTNRYPSTTSTTSTSRRSTRSWASTSPEQGLECLARDESRAAGFVHRPGSHKSRTSRHPLRTAGFQQNELFHI